MRTGARDAEREVEGAVSRGGEVQAEGAPAAGLGVGGAQPCQRYTARLPVRMEHCGILYIENVRETSCHFYAFSKR